MGELAARVMCGSSRTIEIGKRAFYEQLDVPIATPTRTPRRSWPATPPSTTRRRASLPSWASASRPGRGARRPTLEPRTGGRPRPRQRRQPRDRCGDRGRAAAEGARVVVSARRADAVAAVAERTGGCRSPSTSPPPTGRRRPSSRGRGPGRARPAGGQLRRAAAGDFPSLDDEAWRGHRGHPALDHPAAAGRRCRTSPGERRGLLVVLSRRSLAAAGADDLERPAAGPGRPDQVAGRRARPRRADQRHRPGQDRHRPGGGAGRRPGGARRPRRPPTSAPPRSGDPVRPLRRAGRAGPPRGVPALARGVYITAQVVRVDGGLVRSLP